MKFYVDFPVANPLRFTRRGVTNNHRANFDQIRYAEAEHAGTQKKMYAQLFENTDPLRPQFFTNFPKKKIEITKYNENGTSEIVQTYTTVNTARTYRNLKYRSACNFSSIDGKLFIYFTSNVEYLDSDFSIQGDLVEHDGRRPNINALEGDSVSFKFDTVGDWLSSVIIDPSDTSWNKELKAEGYIVDYDINLLEPVTGLVEITYDEKEVDLFYKEISLSGYDEGIYTIAISFGLSSFDMIFDSEPIYIKEEHKNTLALQYRHNGTYDDEEQHGYLYLSDWVNVLRLPAKHHEMTPSGEVTVYEDDFGNPSATRAVPDRQVTFKAFNIPTWVLDKLNLIFAHDELIINEYQWEKSNFGSADYAERTDFVIKFEIPLKQKGDRRLASTEFESSLTASFTPSSIEEVYGGGVTNVTFNCSAEETIFKFQNLPSWITTDVDEFENGDVIEVTIAANAGYIERSYQLVAVSDDIEGLTATIDVEQAFNVAAPGYVDVAETYVDFPSIATSYPVNVSASSAWSITKLGGASWLTVTEVSGTQLSLAVLSNGTTSSRTETVRVYLDSDATKYKDITVEQYASSSALSINISPTEWELEYLPDVLSLSVIAPSSLTHQAKSNNSWLTIDTTLKTGNATRSVSASKWTGKAARMGSVTVFSTDNPTNQKTLLVTQNPNPDLFL
jgi:hypothetical protein